MLSFSRSSLLTLSVLSLLALPARANHHLTGSLKQGHAELKSAGPLAFGPEGILFVGDTAQASIFAIGTEDTHPAEGHAAFKVEAVNQKVAAALGTDAQQIQINDLAVNPISRNIYLSVHRGLGPDAIPVLVRIDTDGKVHVVSLNSVKFASASLPNAPENKAPGGRGGNPRMESITDLAFEDGRVLVAGLSNEEFSSSLRSIPFPFSKIDQGASIEMFHGAHGRIETASPVRTFVPYSVGGESHLLAAYTCTPLVSFPTKDLKPGAHVKGRTIAELGNRNRPLDMIVYQKGGKDYLLLANNNRGIMKITTDGIANITPITTPVRGGGAEGLAYETIGAWKGITQLDRFDKDRALVLRTTDSGAMDLEALELP